MQWARALISYEFVINEFESYWDLNSLIFCVLDKTKLTLLHVYNKTELQIKTTGSSIYVIYIYIYTHTAKCEGHIPFNSPNKMLTFKTYANGIFHKQK